MSEKRYEEKYEAIKSKCVGLENIRASLEIQLEKALAEAGRQAVSCTSLQKSMRELIDIQFKYSELQYLLIECKDLFLETSNCLRENYKTQNNSDHADSCLAMSQKISKVLGE